MKCLIIMILLFSCVCHSGCLRSDINFDGKVDIQDLAILASEWLQEEDCEMALGDELTINGAFTDPVTEWTVGFGDVSIAGGMCTFGAGNAYQPIETILGRTYRYSFEITGYVSGYFQPLLGLNAGVTYAEDGSYYEDITIADNDEPTAVVSGAGVFNVDNVSVKEVLADGGAGLDLDLGAKDVWEF